MEAAKLAMPNTKVVDENGNPLVVYNGDRMKDNVSYLRISSLLFIQIMRGFI